MKKTIAVAIVILIAACQKEQSNPSLQSTNISRSTTAGKDTVEFYDYLYGPASYNIGSQLKYHRIFHDEIWFDLINKPYLRRLVYSIHKSSPKVKLLSAILQDNTTVLDTVNFTPATQPDSLTFNFPHEIGLTPRLARNGFERQHEFIVQVLIQGPSGSKITCELDRAVIVLQRGSNILMPTKYLPQLGNTLVFRY